MILSSRGILSRGLVYHPHREIYPDQIQQVGIDLTVKEVKKINGGIIRSDDNPKEKVSIDPFTKFSPFTEDDGRQYYILSRLTAYSITFEEECRIPPDYTGFIKHRSSLMRVGGFANSAIFDPGYQSQGGISCVIFTFESVKVEVGARLSQMYFIQNYEVLEEDLYNGQYQGHKNIK